jgi:signal peptidase
MNQRLFRPARRAVGAIGLALFVGLVGFAAFTHLAPLSGHQLFIIGGGSMAPAIPIGSLVVVRAVDPGTIVVGDVVTIRGDNGVVVTHRVSGVLDSAGGREFETRGDANPGPDGGLVPARAILGVVERSVPYAGYAQAFLSRPLGTIAALSFLGALFLLYLVLELLEPARPVPLERRAPVGP